MAMFNLYVFEVSEKQIGISRLQQKKFSMKLLSKIFSSLHLLHCYTTVIKTKCLDITILSFITLALSTLF